MIKKLATILILVLLFQGASFEIDATRNAHVHNNQGVNNLKSGFYKAAIIEFKIAIELAKQRPESAVYYNNLGIAYNKINRAEWAKDCFEIAIEKNPNSFQYHLNLIDSYFSLKILNKKRYEYEKILDADKTNSRAWLMLGLVYNKMGLKKEALSALKNYRMLEPKLILSSAVSSYIDQIQKEFL